MPHRFVILLAAFSILNCDSRAAKPAQRIPAVPAGSEAVDRAVERGVGFLISRLSPTGAIIDANGGPRFANVFTGLSFLALVSAGHEPADPTPEGFALRMSEGFLLREDRVGGSGYLGGTDGSTLHGHSITCIALGEVARLGQPREQRKLARRRFQDGVNFIASRVRANQEFGFEKSRDISSSISWAIGGWQSVDLAMFEDFGLGSVRSEMNAIVGVYEIRWTPRGRQLRQIEPALSAAGLLAMKIRGVRGAGYGNARISLAGGTFKHHLGDVMAAWLAALDSGRTSARSSRPAGTSNLVQWQKPGGDWPTKGYDGKVTGPVYATASTLLALTAADHRLAFLQQKRR